MDGCFVPNLTFGPKMVADIKKRTALPIDSHLMIDAPERYIEEFAKAGSEYITVHLEATNHVHRALQVIKKLGVKAGLALNPERQRKL
jgi:ribulose-phosphate 3-epimerase